MAKDRILVIANNALTKSNSNGQTLLKNLSAFSYDEIITFSIDSSLPDYNAGIAHFKLTDKVKARHFIGRHAIGKIILNSDCSVSNSINISPSKSKGFKESAFGHILREIVWKYGRWDKRFFYSFVEEYKPTKILFMCGRSTFMNNIVLELNTKFHLPIYVFTTEDEYFHKYPFYYFLKNYLQLKLVKSYKRLMLKTTKVICQHEKLTALFKNEFNKNTVTIMPSLSFYDFGKPIINVNGHFLYIGNVQPNRFSSIIEFSKTLAEVNKNEKIDIYSADITLRIKRKLEKCKNIKIFSPVPADEIESLMKTAKVLFHIESFKKKDRVFIQNSFSTKIPNSLSSGVPFIVFSPTYTGFYDYFTNYFDKRIISSSPKELKENIISILKDPESFILNELTNARKFHSREKNALYFKNELVE